MSTEKTIKICKALIKADRHKLAQDAFYLILSGEISWFKSLHPRQQQEIKNEWDKAASELGWTINWNDV